MHKVAGLRLHARPVVPIGEKREIASSPRAVDPIGADVQDRLHVSRRIVRLAGRNSVCRDRLAVAVPQRALQILHSLAGVTLSQEANSGCRRTRGLTAWWCTV